LINENNKIFGIKKPIFYFLLVLLIGVAISFNNYKNFLNHINIDGEENEEDPLQEMIILNSEPIENEII
jgi:hypothetical protein